MTKKERRECTATDPCTEDHENDYFWVHRDNFEVGEQEDGYPGGDLITLECRHCQRHFKIELPQ